MVPIFQTVLARGVSTGGTKTSRFSTGAAEVTEKRTKRAQKMVIMLKFMADLNKGRIIGEEIMVEWQRRVVKREIGTVVE